MVRFANRLKSSAVFVGIWWLVGLLTTAVVIEMGDFGLPKLLAPFCLFAVLTVGLPTFIALVSATFVFGLCFEVSSPPIFVGFLAFFATVSLCLHHLAFRLLAGLKKLWRTR